MTRNVFCLLTSLVLILLSFLHAFGALAWYGEQFAADPVRIGTITLAYPIIAWAVVRAVRSTGGDGLFGALVMVASLGGMHLALQGWWSYSRGGMALDEEYSAALPVSGALMIVLSVTVMSYCLAAHAGRKRKFMDAFAVFLVVMSTFQGASMFFIQLHAVHVYEEGEMARLDAEIQKDLDDTRTALDKTAANMREVNRILGRIDDIQQGMKSTGP